MSRKLQPRWSVHRVTTRVEVGAKSYRVFPILDDESRPLLFSRTLKHARYVSCLTAIHNELFRLASELGGPEPSEVTNAKVRARIYEMLDELHGSMRGGSTMAMARNSGDTRSTLKEEVNPMSTEDS